MPRLVPSASAPRFTLVRECDEAGYFNSELHECQRKPHSGARAFLVSGFVTVLLWSYFCAAVSSHGDSERRARAFGRIEREGKRLSGLRSLEMTRLAVVLAASFGLVGV